jgi:lactate dehydrogenase-like 2-hydroxyacid dehydrogenase
MKPIVIVTRKWPANVEARLAELYDVRLNDTDIPMTTAALKIAMQTADALLPTVTDALSADIINVPDRRVKMIGNFGVGYNHIDIQAAKVQGITVTNTPHVLTDCTADIAILLLLMSARRASEGERMVREKRWTGWRPTQLLGQKVSGKTLGLIGFGRIAQAVARRAHFGFGMRIIFFNPSRPDRSITEPLQAVAMANAEEVLKQADFISLHCPGGTATRHLIDADRLALMKPSAHLINTARGDVVDTKALTAALQERRIAGAGLDVYEGEPTIDPVLLTLDNVALLPHLGSASEETRTAMGNRVLANIEAFFAGSKPPDSVV